MTSTLAFALCWIAAQEQAPLSYSDDVRPILAEHCFACHGPDDAARSANLRLDTAEGLAGHGKLTSSIVPGDPEDSELVYRVTTDEAFDRMPPPDAGPGLDADEVDVLRRWIEEGATWESHWAYAPFREVETASNEDAAIDTFVQRALESRGLTAAPSAAPVDLLRRVHFDLTGLPPSDELRTRFAADPTEAAYHAIVDELLGSTAHAEHWARHWLDLARYADSHGFTIDGGRTIWPWRDQVVAAIARDQPYDEFTIEQLAGDLLPNATREQRIATGFHRNTQINQEGGAGDEENRVSAVIDRVATTGSVWLGSSIACAQCHTHKFDPITQTEYFGLFAFFNSTKDSGVSTGPTVLVPRSEKEEALASAWEAALPQARAGYEAAWNAAAPGFRAWQPARATGSNGPELRAEEDGSYRVVGQGPVYSTYVLEGSAPVDRARVLRLEVLPDGGPGRTRNRNFVLQRVHVDVRAADGSWTPVAITSARASHEQGVPADPEAPRDPYPVASLVTGNDGPGWAILPVIDVPLVAELMLEQSVDLADTVLRVELVQEHGGNHTIGSFRILLGDAQTADEEPLVPAAWSDAWKRYHAKRGERPRIPSTLAMEEREEPRVTRRFERGSFLDPQEAVASGFPAALDHFSPRGGDEPLPTNRLDLARWLVHPANALVHRVTVNRWWQQLFGTGLVATESDFGLRGMRPTHPDLLEWLAEDFVASGFSRRHVLRRIVRSDAYRRATFAGPEVAERDPSNEWLARQNRRRLTGEELHDRMLAVSGVLDRTVGGPPVQPPQPDGVFAFTQSRKSWETSVVPKRFRRSLYTRIWRSSPFPFYATFDAPAANVACTRRSISRTPLQALALANDPMVMELAARFGARIASEAKGDKAARIGTAIGWALGREASDAEVERLLPLVEAISAKRGDEAAWTALARVLFNVDEFSHRP